MSRARVRPVSGMRGSVLREQERINESAASARELYAQHRERLTEAISSLAQALRAPTAPQRPLRMALLGAGNCNDVDLDRLGRDFEEVHLVDLDAAALTRACGGRTPELQARLHRHAPVDLSGVLGDLPRWRRRSPSHQELDAVVEPGVASALVAVGVPPVDVAVSCCVGTQLAFHAAEVLGREHPLLPDVRRRMATVHLRTLAALVRPGGRGLFVTDTVSSETYPLEELAPDADLTRVLERLIADGNYLFGGEPPVYAQLLRRDAVLAAGVTAVERLSPWLWQAGEEKTFLVSGFSFIRR